jgi:hypothetical protein
MKGQRRLTKILLSVILCIFIYRIVLEFFQNIDLQTAHVSELQAMAEDDTKDDDVLQQKWNENVPAAAVLKPNAQPEKAEEEENEESKPRSPYHMAAQPPPPLPRPAAAKNLKNAAWHHLEKSRQEIEAHGIVTLEYNAVEGLSIPIGYTGDFRDIFPSLFKEGFKSVPLQTNAKEDESFIGTHNTTINYLKALSYRVYGSVGNLGQLERRITLFSQLSMDRFHLLSKIVNNWDSCISVAIYIENYKQLLSLEAKLKEFERHNHGKLGITTRSVVLSLLFGIEFLFYSPNTLFTTQVDPKHPSHPSFIHHQYDLLYPINALRNLALSQANSPLVFSLDIDFLPSAGLYSSIIHPYNIAHISSEKPPSIMIIPSFEHLPNTSPPLTFSSLVKSCSSAATLPFHSKLSPHSSPLAPYYQWCSGKSESVPHSLTITPIQSMTNYTRWWKSSQPYLLKTYPKTHLNRYFEPYFVTRKVSISSI